MTDNPHLTLMTAQTTAEVLGAVARREWWQAHAEDEAKRDACPMNMIPSEAALAEWYPQCPAEAKAEAARILSAIAWHDAIDGLVAYSNLDPHMLPSWKVETRYDLSALEGLASEEEITTAIRTAPQIKTLMAHVPTDADAALTFHAGMKLLMPMVHQAWQIMPMKKRPDHPLRPLVCAWQEWKTSQPREVTPFIPKRRSSLARLHRIAETETMPDFARDSGNRQYTFTGEGFTPAIDYIPHWILALYDTKRGLPLQDGRTAPRSMRLLAGAFLHLGRTDRNGELASLKLPLGYVIRWLHPDFDDEGDPRSMGDLWAGRDDWKAHWKNWNRDWEAFPEALGVIDRDLGRVLVGGTMKRVAAVGDIPLTPDQNMVEFWLRIPKIAADGMRVDWRLLCWLGKHHPIGYRAMFAAASILDRSAKKGHPQTRGIPPPLLDAEGVGDGQKPRIFDGIARFRGARQTG